MARKLAICACAAYAVMLVITATTRAALDVFTKSTRHERTIGYGQVRYQGAGPERWAQRWRVQHRQVLALRRALSSRLDRIVWLVDAFQCIHSHEGSWTDSGAPYWGGLQFGSSEWSRFGGQFASTANYATPSQQIAAGISYWSVSGFAPWPNTARMCGLR